MATQILAISGSLRSGSHNSELLRVAGRLLPPGIELRVHDGLRDIPPFDEDAVESRPGGAQRLWDELSAADAVLISTPEYNHSMPGQLKNALDWMSRPLAETPLLGKPAAVVGASTGMFGAVWAQAETRKVLGAIGARVLDLELPIPNAQEQFHPEGGLVDEEIERALISALSDLDQRVRELVPVSA